MSAVNGVHALVREFALRRLAPRGITILSDEESLVDRGVVNSLGVFEIIAFLERTFTIRVADEEITIENLGTIDAIARLVVGKLGGHEAAN